MILMWTDNLSVGVKNLDDDHRRLIRLINELHGVIQDVDANGKIPVEEIEIALHRLENYFSYHCLEEERLMEQTGFPELREHRQQHQKFFATIALGTAGAAVAVPRSWGIRSAPSIAPLPGNDS